MIADDGASVFSKMLKVNQSLEELEWDIPLRIDNPNLFKINCDFSLISSLSWNKITDVGASVLGEMLKVNQSLKELEWVVHVLLEDSQLQSNWCHLYPTFSLSGNTIFDLGASVLSEMLKVNQSLKELEWVVPLTFSQPEQCLIFSLGQCEISDRGTSVLGEMLEANHSLEALEWVIPLGIHNLKLFKATGAFSLTFSLSGNKITDRGASVLGEMLEVNQSLKKLEWVVPLEDLQLICSKHVGKCSSMPTASTLAWVRTKSPIVGHQY